MLHRRRNARLSELRNKMSKEKAEVDKLLSQRGSTLWTSSTEIRASKQTRNACLTMPIASKPKPDAHRKTPGPMMTPPQEAITGTASYRPGPTKRHPHPPSRQTAGAVSSNQMAVQSSASQKSAVPTRSLPAKQSPTLQHSNSASRQLADASCSAGRSGSLAADSNSAAGTLTAARSGGKGRAGDGVTVLNSEGSCGSSIQGLDASGCLASPSCGRSGGMGSGLDTGWGRTKSVSHREGVSVRGVTSPAQAKPVASSLRGPSLLDGNFNEDDSHASFADALSSWRGKGPPKATALPVPGPAAAPGPTAAPGPHAAPGTSTQAGAGLMPTGSAAAVNAPALTYFERLVWNQASQSAAAAVAGKPVR
ncbi:hypothetical protein ABBQ32_000701 [Trebouxia sp. C0010 RCD-2024]